MFRVEPGCEQVGKTEVGAAEEISEDGRGNYEKGVQSHGRGEQPFLHREIKQWHNRIAG